MLLEILAEIAIFILKAGLILLLVLQPLRERKMKSIINVSKEKRKNFVRTKVACSCGKTMKPNYKYIINTMEVQTLTGEEMLEHCL
jgi:hypothetical protein